MENGGKNHQLAMEAAGKLQVASDFNHQLVIKLPVARPPITNLMLIKFTLGAKQKSARRCPAGTCCLKLLDIGTYLPGH